MLKQKLHVPAQGEGAHPPSSPHGFAIRGRDSTLRVADRFTVNRVGKIIEQENHFDPRDVTNPGWQIS